ncbi:hypothetical protein Trydic_g20169 [Trypoxylus dichotomus]
MANFFLAACLFRIALPLLILTCALFRPSLLSAIYLCLLLCSALVPVPTTKTMAGSTGIYLKILIAISVLGFLLQLAFQIVLLSLPPYGHFLEACKIPETILTYCGFVRLDNANGIIITTWIAPEIVMVCTALTTFFFSKKLTTPAPDMTPEDGEFHPKTKPRRNFGFWVSLVKYIGLLSLCVTSVLRPSVPGAFYFLVFISSSTWWACYRELERGFAIVCRIVMVIVFLHIGCLYVYQFQWTQEQLDPSSPYIRYLGIEPLFNTSCSNPRQIDWLPIAWDSYVNPLALIWLFYIMAIVSKNLLEPKMRLQRDTPISERTPLMRGVSPSRRYGSGGKKTPAHIIQDSTGSVTVTDNPEDIALSEIVRENGEEEKPGCFEHAVIILESLIQFIIQSSYIATNIIMMTWSITFHSWLTFVLLLWANILWMIPNQRRSMLRSSPFLVCYAIFLLLSAYVFSMDIDELPDTLEQIGFKRIREYPCNPLLVKCLFTVMFWITLRQYVKEIKEARHTNTLADMAAPLQVTVTAATGVTREQQEEQEAKVLKNIGEHLKTFLSRIWIWVVAITLFAVAITGERMTAFRILYMALFLFFIITFQLSFRIWMKDFHRYWTEYLHISRELQLDIGLEEYKPAQLFIRLATPTFFVIVTVIQLHYFHRDFIKYSMPSVQPTSEEDSSVQGRVLEQNGKEDDTDISSNLTSLKIDLTDLGNVSTAHLRYKLLQISRRTQEAINLTFTFLEIHMAKFVLLMAMLMCIYDQCALYYIVVLLVIVSITSGRRLQFFVIYTVSVFTSVLLLSRMVYQIQYIKHENWNVSCEKNVTGNVTLNTAEWLGFRKTLYGRDLPRLVQWNIAYLVAVTLFTVVLVRQFNYKMSKGKPTTRTFFMFSGITRDDSERDLKTALKYLANYGYFKFGVEISLMATVALIGFRMDLYAILYAFWLCMLFALNRTLLSRVWYFYMCFIAIFIPIQYVMVVGLPPFLCLDFPWDYSRLLRQLQEWAFLMDYERPPAAKKLVFDVILLLFVARQSVVFRIERRYKDKDYPGGSNESIIHHAEESNFENPVPDFITFARSYLDIAKRMIFLGFMWLTLAIVFLAGANRVNIFSIGYLVGSFVFLWQGSDIYLRPIPKILKSWNGLLGYNVVVILSKTILQLVGCVFLGDISECWLVQLLGIGCVRKFNGVPANLPEDMCEVPRDYIGLVWDGICFGFLITQRRIFCSYNFFHVIDETKATTILASRGAELIEQLRQKRMHEQDEQERRILEKIKNKMDRIKATQQKMQGPYTTTTNHYVGQPPLARSSSVSSCASATSQQTPEAGYHTPIDEDEPAPLTPAAGSLIQAQAPSPFSAIMTVSLEGYLEPQRMSFSSPPNSELNPRPPSPDDSYPVFSPPPYDAAPPYAEVVNVPPAAPQRQTSIGPPWMNGALITPRQSIISYSSRSPLSHHTYGLYPRSRPLYRTQQPKTYKQAIRSGDYYMFDELDDDDDLEMIDELTPESSESDISDEDDKNMEKRRGSGKRRRTLGQLLSTAIKTDIGTTIRGPDRRRASIPLSRQRSTVSGRSQYSAAMSAPPIVLCFFRVSLTDIESIREGKRDPRFYVRKPRRTLLIRKKKKVHLSPVYPDELVRQRSRRGTSELQQLVEEGEDDEDEEPSMEFTGMDNVANVVVKEVPAHDMFPDNLHMTTSKYFESIRDFFVQLKDPTSRVAVDVYSYMFMCDFFNFFVILIGYSSFGTQQGDGGVSSYLEDNRVPILFLLMLILQFTLILVDRAIFLRKNIVSKIVFQFVQIIVLHIWLFVLFPVMTERKFNSVLPPQMYYMVKCFYLLLSAYQIRCGYPSRILGNFLCKGYNYVNMFLFKGFMLIPFLFELRTVMDWMWTDTSMTIFDWIKMEDIFAHIFQLKEFVPPAFLQRISDSETDKNKKCSRHVEDEFPQPRGERKSPTIKYMMGGIILFVIVAIIWFPLVFFSLGNAVGEPNPPYDVTLDLRIGPYEPVYHLSAQSNAIYQFDDRNLGDFLQTYKTNKYASAFITNYEPQDIVAVKLSRDSSNLWSISPPDRQRMIDEINSTNPISIRLQYIVSHGSNNKEVSGVIREENIYVMEARVDGKPNVERQKLLEMLNGNDTVPPVKLGYILPKFLKVTNRGTATPVPQMMKMIDDVKSEELRKLELILRKSAENEELEWWEIFEICNDTNYEDILSKLPFNDCSSVMLYAFNDRIFPETLNLITAGGIIGLYTTLVLLASRGLRGFFAEICFKIMFDDMPNVDRVLQLCLDIYLVREAREFCLEEDLFAKLVFLFRSPETLIKWTRPKEEVADDEDPEGEPE